MTGLRLHSHQTSEAESEHRSAFRCSALPHHLTTVATWVTVKHSGVGGAYPPAPTGTCHYHSISTSTSTLGCGLAQQRKDWRERTWGDRKIGGGKRKVDQLILQLHVPDSGTQVFPVCPFQDSGTWDAYVHVQ